MRPIARVVGMLVTLSSLIGAASVMLMMIQIVIDVVSRNLFSFAVPGMTTLVTNYYMLIVAYLPLALAERLDGHIVVEVAAQLLGRRLRQWLHAATWAASAVISGVVAYALWGEAIKAYGYGSFVIEFSHAIPIWPGYFVLPIGFGLYALVLAVRLGCAVTGIDEDEAFGTSGGLRGSDTVGEA